MKHSESIDKLAGALAKVQGALIAAPKQKTNPHFKSKYADLPALWEVSRKALSDNGLALLQLPKPMDGGICIETVVTHSSGQWISDEGLFVPATKQDAQGFGSALTYARRYGMGAILGLVSDEDDDGNAAAAKPAVTPATKAPERDIADWIVIIAEAANRDELKSAWDKAVALCREYDDEKAMERVRTAAHKRGEQLKEAV